MDKAAHLDFVVEIIRRSDDHKGFQVLPRRWVVERTFGWMMRWRRLVRDSRGRGTVATGKKFEMIGGTPLTAGADTLLQNLETIGTSTQAEVLEFRHVRPPAMIADALRVPRDCEILKAVRLRRHNDKPLALSTSFLIDKVAATITEEALNHTSLIQLLSQSGIEISLVEQTISATLADDTTAVLLQIPSGAPLIRIRRTFFTHGDTPIDHVEILYPAERFEYRMTLTR